MAGTLAVERADRVGGVGLVTWGVAGVERWGGRANGSAEETRQQRTNGCKGGKKQGRSELGTQKGEGR